MAYNENAVEYKNDFIIVLFFDIVALGLAVLRVYDCFSCSRTNCAVLFEIDYIRRLGGLTVGGYVSQLSKFSANTL